MEVQQSQGLLDLAVELSTRDITAGNEFTVFVLIKNPFAKPVWIRRVHVSLPSELVQATAKVSRKEEIESQEQKKLETDLKDSLDTLEKQIADLKAIIEQSPSKNTQEMVEQLEKVAEKLNDQLSATKVTVHLSGSSVRNIRVGANMATVVLDAADGEGSSAGDIEILGPDLIREEYARTKRVELESSLPRNVALQPGNTAVYSIVLKARKAILFTPSKFRLQFSVNYSFNPQPRGVSDDAVDEQDLYTNTVAYELSIRASVYSLILGAALGGLAGGTGRILQISQPTEVFSATNFITVVVAIILSMAAIVFMGRKSETQSFLSIEDFWGGLLVGFLVGYTGSSFFQSLTGIEIPKA